MALRSVCHLGTTALRWIVGLELEKKSQTQMPLFTLLRMFFCLQISIQACWKKVGQPKRIFFRVQEVILFYPPDHCWSQDCMPQPFCINHTPSENETSNSEENRSQIRTWWILLLYVCFSFRTIARSFYFSVLIGGKVFVTKPESWGSWLANGHETLQPEFARNHPDLDKGTDSQGMVVFLKEISLEISLLVAL